MTALSGGCACGQVRFVAALASFDAYLCHCRMCQRATGSVSIAFVNLPQADVRWDSECDWWRSSPIAERGLCRTCGTSLAFRYVDNTAKMDLTVAAFDDPSRFRCTAHFGVESRHAAFSTGLEGLPEQAADDYSPLTERWAKAGTAAP